MQTGSKTQTRNVISCDIPQELTGIISNPIDFHFLKKNELTKIPAKGDSSPTKSDEKSQISTTFSECLSSQHNDIFENDSITAIDSPLSIAEDSCVEEENLKERGIQSKSIESKKVVEAQNNAKETPVIHTPTENPSKISDIPSYQDKNSKVDKKSLSILNSEDEQVLLRLVVQLKNSWKKITKRFNKLREKNASLTMLKKRYNLLVPKLFKKKGKFTHQEDLLLAKYYSEFGCDWAKISNQIKNRTPNMLKNRYYSHVKKRRLLNDLLQELKSNVPVISEKVEKVPMENSIKPASRKVDLESLVIFKGLPGCIQKRVLMLPIIDELALEMNGMVMEDSLVDKINNDGYNSIF
jgi:hypothetical protein